MILAARATLIAGAKYYVEPSRHFSNRSGRFAARYMDSVLMGHTDPGSYIVTAYAPVESLVPLHATELAPMSYRGIDGAPARAVTTAVAQAVKAAEAALADYRQAGNLEVFDDVLRRVLRAGEGSQRPSRRITSLEHHGRMEHRWRSGAWQ